MKNYSGKTINQYYLAKDLGQGGMVVVYKAFDNVLNRDVVVKMVRTEDLDGKKRTDILQRFMPLANSLLQLNHPNIAPMLDYGFFEDVPYLVAEYLPGGTLKQRMRKQLTLNAAIQVLSPVADALIFAHDNGVLHQDFKPSNVLFHNQDKRPMLTDLGIASLFSDSVFDPELFELGFGTPAYMAPEQWRGLATEQSDVYSVGIVFYEMLTGKIANKTETPLAAAFKQNEGLIPDPTQMIGGLSVEVQHFFFKCLAVELVNRFQTMREMKLAMERLNLTVVDRHNSGLGSSHSQTAEPPVKQDSSVIKPGYEATRIKPIQEEPLQQQHQPVATPLPIHEDFHPSLKPDYIKSRVVPQPSAAPLPPIQLQQKPVKGKKSHGKPAKNAQSEGLPEIRGNSWIAALVLGLSVGLSHVLKVVIIDQVDFINPVWISGLIGRTVAWFISGLAIFFYYRLTTKQILFPVGISGFVLAGIIPTLLDKIVPSPYGSWLSEITFWTMLGLGIVLMFHGPEKLLSKQGLALVGGWTLAGVFSVMPLLIFPSKFSANTEVPLTIHLVRAIAIGPNIGRSLHNSFSNYLKPGKSGLYWLAGSSLVACVISSLIFYGMKNIYLASGLSWFVITTLILVGVALAQVQPTAQNAHLSQSEPNMPQNGQ